jgi:hypothetical protein
LLVAIVAIAIALLSLAAGALFERALIAITAVPLILITIVFAAGAWNTRTSGPDGLTSSERRNPADGGSQTGGSQTHGAVGGDVFGGT